MRSYYAGYSPGQVVECPDRSTAVDELLFEMRMQSDAFESWNDQHDCDDAPCPTYGDDCNWMKAQEIRLAAEELRSSAEPAWSATAAGVTYSIEPAS